MITREAIITELNVKGFEVKPVDITKNGIPFKGISLGTGPVCPTIYTDRFEEYNEEDLEDAVDEILYQYNKAKEMMPAVDAQKLMDWEYVKTRLQLCLQKRTDEDICKRDFLDLEEYVRVIVDTDEESTGSFKVKPEHLNLLGVTETDVFDAAWKCTDSTIIVQDMAVLMAEMMGMSIEEAMEMQSDNPMIVASNERKMYGAIAMKAGDKIAEVADRYGTDLAILPSSIHEILLIPVRRDMDFIQLNAMVQEINATQVAPEEILGSHAYRYNRVEHSITYYCNTKGGKHIFG